MLEFKQDDTAVNIILTLSESVTLPAPNYLFVFTHVLTKDVVSFVKLFTDDLSLYQARYNKFLLDPAVLFTGKDVGEWHYAVYEQASTTNTDVTLTGGVLEYGKLMLNRAVEFAFTEYDSATSFKTYNG
jgi:hypothetical protein